MASLADVAQVDAESKAAKEAKQRDQLRAFFPDAEEKAIAAGVQQGPQSTYDSHTAPVAGVPIYDSHTSPVAPNETPSVQTVAPEISTPKAAAVAPPAKVQGVTEPGPESQKDTHVGALMTPEIQAEMDKAKNGGAAVQSPVSAKAEEIAQEVKKDPKIGEKLLQMAKDTGKSLLELVQGFAVGYSGSNIPLAAQVKEAEKQLKSQQDAAAAESEKQREWQAAQMKADQDFQMRVSQINQDWQDKRFAAATEADRQAADAQRAHQSAEAQKDRDSALQIAREQLAATINQRTQTRSGGLSEALAKIAAMGQ